METKNRSECKDKQTEKTPVKQSHLVVNGCDVTLFFAPSDETVRIEDIKKMILNGMAMV